MTSRFKVTGVHFVLVACILLTVISGVAWWQDHQQLTRLSESNRDLASGITAMHQALADQEKRAAEQKNVVHLIKTTVTAADLDSQSSDVIGRLGFPLLQMLTVRGIWRSYREGIGKGSNLEFHVTYVNGKALDKPVAFQRELVHAEFPLSKNDDKNREKPIPTNGETWEIRAFETGSFHGTPATYDAEIGDTMSRQRAVWDSRFVVTLSGIMQRPGATGDVAFPEKVDDGENGER